MVSSRADRPLIRGNGAATPQELSKSEFFGQSNGTFTGAERDRVGRSKLADSGAPFLDEIGEIALELQGKLFRFLSERTLERVGDKRTPTICVRVIAAANRDLAIGARVSRFRENPFLRFNVFSIHFAPLRDRPAGFRPASPAVGRA